MSKQNASLIRRARACLCTAAAAALMAFQAPTSAATSDSLRMIDNLYGTHFANASDGWAVGAFGTIFRTRDGGQSWKAQPSNTFEQLFGVSFVDAQNGWAVGRTGIILHTTNGGDSWQRQTSPSDKHLFEVTALDTQRAWAIGDWGVIVTTRDGGITWEDKSLDRDVILYAESWPDAQNAWIVGEMGAILHTSDGGQTWADQTSGIEKTLFGVYFQDAKRGWASGLDGIILRTEDGGTTWSVQRGKSEVSALDQVGVAEAFENATIYDIAIAGDTGYAVGDIGSVFLTKDGGNTWQRKEVPGEWKLGWIRAVTLVPGGRGLFVGASGLAIRVEGDQIKLPAKN